MKKNILYTVLFLFAFLIIISYNFLILPKDFFKNISYSQVIYDRNNEILRIYLSKDEQFILQPSNSKEIPTKLKETVIFYEDKNFYRHKGFDIKALFRAIYKNIKNNKIVSGASTISMQTIRIFRGGKRNYFNKFIELIYAVQLELKYTKEEILNIYLSHCPYGGNIRGYRGASLRYFNKIPKELTWAEAVTLAILPNAPSMLSTVKNREKFIEKRNKVLYDLYLNGKISKEDYILSKAEELPETLYSIPQNALFFTDFVKSKEKKYEIKTTLDLKKQKKVEEIVEQHKMQLEKYGIYNTAVMVVDTKSREILAYIGGTYENEKAGKIDAIQVKRSSASTLKPFLYALSFDKGLISSQSLLIDVPSYFNAFNPVNSDKRYRGLIRADRALALSLNVPLVKLLENYGYRNFHDFLKDSNISSLKNPEYYGLSMILGSIYISPYELAKLYTDLGNLGLQNELKYLLEESKQKEVKFAYSKGATWLTLDILSTVERPNTSWEFFQNRRDFYWKTGTSFGERDAWAVGTNSEYTIVVWNGNLDNSSSSKLKGIDSSAPLLFDILNSIGTMRGTISQNLDDLDKVELSKNGYRSKYSQNNIEAYIPKGVVMTTDPFEKLIYTNLEGTKQVDSRSHLVTESKEKIINSYPPQVNYFLKLRGIEIDNIEKLLDSKKLEFIYPQNNLKLRIPKNNSGEYEKIVVEVAEVEANEYYWYLNGKYYGRSDKGKILMEFEKGFNKIDLATDIQRSSSVYFYVE